MTKAGDESRKRIPNPLSEEQRARDAVEAMRDYEAARQAEFDKTARLREQRLARDAALAASPPAPAKAPKRSKKKSAK